MATEAIKSEQTERSSKKKTVVMASDAKVGDGKESSLSNSGGKKADGGEKSGGLGKGRKKNYSEVIYADKEVEKMEEQCKQQ